MPLRRVLAFKGTASARSADAVSSGHGVALRVARSIMTTIDLALATRWFATNRDCAMVRDDRPTCSTPVPTSTVPGQCISPRNSISNSTIPNCASTERGTRVRSCRISMRAFWQQTAKAALEMWPVTVRIGKAQLLGCPYRIGCKVDERRGQGLLPPGRSGETGRKDLRELHGYLLEQDDQFDAEAR